MRYKIIFFIPLFAGVLFASCSLWKTREAENPITDNQTNESATSADQVIANLISSLQQKNIHEYEKVFSDTITHTQTYTFIPTQSSAVRYLAVFSSWNKTSEADCFRNIVSAIGSSSIQVSITTISAPIRYQSDSALFRVRYSLVVPHQRTDFTTQITGESDLYLSPNKNNIWMIYRWVDYETKKDSSWSELKGQFSR
ncbi:MAG: hypothetical protein H3C35_01925 [Bacteroidetes bacterium]|nr:hypothetical protein [Bacteroidota bacterium]